MSQLHLLSPLGFSAAGVAAKIKSTGKKDVGLLLCQQMASAAAVFTTNRVFAAPVKIGRLHIASGKLRGVVVNSGNANACTGLQGQRDALEMCQLAGELTGAAATAFLPSSTGIIGHTLPMEKVRAGLRQAAGELGASQDHALGFAEAIMTTDLKRKAAAARFKVGKRTVTLAGVCKGSGMIGPRLALKPSLHATMLAYVTTDAEIAPLLLRKLMAQAAEKSFNAVTVDDQTSTNDTAAILASGMSGAKISDGAGAKRFAAALTEVCQSLAIQIAADGEGASKVVAITVRSAASEAAAKIIARSIANSPLVKCAMHGNDPNWGRILCAAGMVGQPFAQEKCVLRLQNTRVFAKGRPLTFDAAKLSAELNAKQVQVVLDCHLGKGEATCWTCDLSQEYVAINADYHT